MGVKKLARLILVLVLFLNACSLFDPFVDRRREAGARDLETLYIGESKPDAHAICYNKLTTTYAEVKKLADEECIKNKTGTYAEPVKQTYFSCRLMLPNHVYFRCEGNTPLPINVDGTANETKKESN